MTYHPTIITQGDTLTRAEKRRETVDDLSRDLDAIMAGLERLAQQADRITKAMDIPGVEDAVHAIEAAADHIKRGADYLEARP